MRKTTLTTSLCALVVLLFGIAGCDDRLVRVEENQIRLQAMVAANARQLATVSSQIHTGNGEVQEGLRSLDQNDRDLAAGVAAVQNEQVSLHSTVRTGHQAIDGRMATLDENQRLLQTGVAQVAGVAQRTASDVTAIAREHATLHRMVQTTKEELGSRIAVVTGNQQDIRTDIGQLQQTDQRIAEQLVAMAAGQDRIYNGLDGLHSFVQAVARDITGISTGQSALRQTLIAGLSDVADNQAKLHVSIDAKADVIGAELTSIAQRQTSLGQGVKTANDALVIQATVMAENRQVLTAGLAGLHEGTQRISTDLSAVVAGQDSIHRTLHGHNDAVGEQITQVSHQQQQLHSQLGTLATTASRTVSDIAGLSNDHAALRQSIQDGMGGLNERTGGLAAQLDGLAERQTTLQQQVRAGNEALTERTAALGSNQETLQAQLDSLTAIAGQSALDILGLHDSQSLLRQAIHAGVNDLAARTDRVSADVAGVATGQASLRDAIGTNHEALFARVATVVDGQKVLRTDIDRVGQKTDEVTANLAQVASNQKTFDQTLKSHAETMNVHAATLAHNQAQLQTGLDNAAKVAGQTALDVLDVAARQNAIAQSQQTYNEAANSQMANLARGQQQMRGGLDSLVATAGQTALDVLAINEGQNLLQKSVNTGIQDLAARTDRVSGEVTAVTAGQTSLRDTITAGHEVLSTRMANMADGQQAVRADIGRVGQRTDEVTANLAQVASAQKAFDQMLKSHAETVNAHAARLADSQAQLQTGLDAITATAGQTALDVLDVTVRQDAIAQNQQNRSDAVGSQMTDLARGQQQVHSNLDTLMATTGQAALDILALGDSQTRLAQAMQTDRQELAARLAGMAEDQQQWIQRLDAAQANVQTLAASVATIERRIATLQGSLQESLDGLTTLLGDDGQKRIEFETRVNQDIQGMADAVAQLSRIEGLLKEQMEQIQNRTQSQMTDLLSAIQQLKQPPAELKISSTGTKLEPSMVEAAAN